MAYEIFNDEIILGRENQPWSESQDFRLTGGKVQARGLMLQEIGNPSQISLGRIGPDNVGYSWFPPHAVEMNQTMGHISWRGYMGTDHGWGDRIAMIYSRFRGAGRGTLAMQTSGVDRLVLTEDGYLDLTGVYDAQRDGIKVIIDGVLRTIPLR